MNKSDTLWKLEPHTGAKHEILKRYLGAWFGILGKHNSRIIFLDGFCGPGRYIGGEDGSPILAIKLALEHQKKNNLHDVSFLFVEEREDRVEHLRKEISKIQIPSTFHISIEHNQFENSLSLILDRLEKRNVHLAPTFAFIDPFGFKGAPFKLVERLLKNPKTEVFINIMIDPINRFLEHPDPQITNHIIELFGTADVLKVVNQDRRGLLELRKLYQSQLLKIAKYVRYFEMCDGNKRIIYDLFFATNNQLGHVKMKEAFWKVDNSAGYQFSDATNPDQLILFMDDNTTILAEMILSKFGGKRVTVGSITSYVEDKTSFLGTHMKKVLRHFEVNGLICVEPCKQGGEKRIKSTFPNDVVVTFK